MKAEKDPGYHTSDRTSRLEELIEKFEALKRDLVPTEMELNVELSRVRQQILDRARARLSFTGDPLKDLCIHKFKTEFRENYGQLRNLREMLNNATGQFTLIHDTSYNLLINVVKETDRCYIPFRVAALGVLDVSPLEVGYEHDITGDRYYLKLRFQDGAYIRELEMKEYAKLDKWLNVLPTFRGREEGYTETSEPLKLVLPMEDYQTSEDYIRDLYISEKPKTKSKKPYWRIAPDRFEAPGVTIGSEPVIEIYEEQEFPKKEYKVFALYIGNEEVSKRVGIDLRQSDTLQKVYDVLVADRGKSEGRSLIF